MAQQPPRHRVTPREERALEHLKLYRVSTDEVIRRVCAPDLESSGVESFLRRMGAAAGRKPLITRQPLYGRCSGWRLTRAGAKHVGAPREIARPLGPQARMDRLALLWFIHAPQADRTLIPSAELRQQFALTAHRLPRQHFYLEENQGVTQLGFIVVDHGGQVRRVVRKANEVLARFLKHGWFDDLIAAGRFKVTIVTATPSKRGAIERQWQPHLERELRAASRRFVEPGRPVPLVAEVVCLAALEPLVLAADDAADQPSGENPP